MSTAQEEADAEYMNRVEADKRSILEQLLTFDYESLSNGGIPSTNTETNKKDDCGPIDESNVKAKLEEEYAKIFGDVDIDDSEEIFNNLLKRVEEEFQSQMKFKENNPSLAATLSAAEEIVLKPERRAPKRKPKAFERSLQVMDNFKKRLLESPPEPEKSPFNFSVPSALVKSSKNTCIPSRSQSSSGKLKSCLKVYPKWKTTSTYTPIFSAPSNPNWASIPTNIEEKELLSQKTASRNKMVTSTPYMIPGPNELGLPKTMNLSKMYTSTQIRNWVHSRKEGEDSNKEVNSDAQIVSSSNKTSRSDAQIHSNSSNKTFRSDQSVCNSELNSDVSYSFMKSPLNSSTPMRDTVVRFRPSPPQYFLFSSDGNSTVSPSSPVIDYKNNVGKGNDFYTLESEEFVYYENNANEQLSHYFNENYSDSPVDYPENYYPVKQPKNHRGLQKFVDFNEGYRNCCNDRQSKKTEERVLNNTSKQPIPSEDFVRNLRYSININYNIINNYK